MLLSSNDGDLYITIVCNYWTTVMLSLFILAAVFVVWSVVLPDLTSVRSS